MGQPRPIFRLFSVFSNKHHYNSYNKYMWKKCPYSIQCRDSNPQPSERVSLPFTTRPGLPSYSLVVKPWWAHRTHTPTRRQLSCWGKKFCNITMPGRKKRQATSKSTTTLFVDTVLSFATDISNVTLDQIVTTVTSGNATLNITSLDSAISESKSFSQAT